MTNPQDRGQWTSASSAGADLLCPGRHFAQRQMGPESPSDGNGKEDAWAASGTHIHDALSGRMPPDKLSLEESETYENCIKIETKLASQFFGPDDAAKAKLFREQRYWVRYKSGPMEWEHSGQPDVVYRSDTRALVADFKTLMADVPESSHNMQLRDLAVLVRGHFVVVDTVAVAVIQPWHTHSPELCVYSKEDLDRAAAELYTRTFNSNQPNAPRLPGELQCKWCRAKAICVEYQRWAGALVPGMASLLDDPVSKWSPRQRGFFLERCSAAEAWLDEIKRHLKDGMRSNPDYVEGWTTAIGRIREVITDPQACFERFVAMGGTMEQFMGTLNVVKTRLRNQVHEVANLKGKKLDEAMGKLTEGIVEGRQEASRFVRRKDGDK